MSSLLNKTTAKDKKNSNKSPIIDSNLKLFHTNVSLDKSALSKINFYISQQKHVVGTQKNSLNEYSKEQSQ